MTWTPPIRLFGSVAAADLNAQWSDNITYLYDNLPHHVTLWHKRSLVTNGNAIAAVNLVTQWYYWLWEQTAAQNGDVFTQSFVCAPGVYTFSILCRTNSDCGIVDWTLDGTSISANMDFYSAASTPNVVKTQAAISILGGRHVLTGTVDGKHASSSAYKVPITKLWFRRTGALP